MFRGYLWDNPSSLQSLTPLATLTETLHPLPRPPLSDLNNQTAWDTIYRNPDLFYIVMPVNIDHFEDLLREHPNRPLVESVCQGLQEGFWPFAETDFNEYPLTWDEHLSSDLTPDVLRFLSDYAREEEEAGRYSQPFGHYLLPGMVSMPIHAVPKPHSKKLRLINNHSAGQFSLNSLIDKSKVGMHPDNVQDLAHNIK
ncbi:hypothetical protein C8Q75DRAFT_723707 [Abortiporus biennis]|nr:hypothetical protein C8Q75DRAFT_723707 [Abortiporus biennis]